MVVQSYEAMGVAVVKSTILHPMADIKFFEKVKLKNRALDQFEFGTLICNNLYERVQVDRILREENFKFQLGTF